MSLQVWKIDSIRWRIGARCGPRPFSSLRRGRMIVASSAASSVSKSLPRKLLFIADQDQHLPECSLAAGDHLQADEFLVDLRGGERERPGSAVGREQSVQPKAPEVAAVAGAVAVIGSVGERVTLGGQE